MKTTVRRWGNSLGVRIPKALAEVAELRDGSLVEMSGEKNMITLSAVKEKATLKSLLGKVTRENLHGESGPGAAQGRELW